MIPVDVGPLVALFDANDHQHDQCRRILHEVDDELLTTTLHDHRRQGRAKRRPGMHVGGGIGGCIVFCRHATTGALAMTFVTLNRPEVRFPFVGWAVPFLLLCVACADSSSARLDPPLVEGERLGTAGAHEHGIARLGLAVDGTRLTVDLQLPAESVFGFERAPRSAEERATVAEALDRLRTGGARLIAFPDGATCALDSAEVQAPEGVEDDHAGEDQHAHEDEGHQHEEDEGGEHEEDEASQHEEVRLLATLTCSREPLGGASLRFADLLPDVVQVDLTVFTAAGEAAGRVAPDASFRF